MLSTFPTDFHGNSSILGKYSRKGNARTCMRKRDREWEREDAPGREWTFKYEQKRARYFSPTLQAKLIGIWILEEDQQPPFTISLFPQFPLERIDNGKIARRTRRYSGHEKFPIDDPETIADLLAKLIVGTKGRDTIKKECVIMC